MRPPSPARIAGSLVERIRDRLDPRHVRNPGSARGHRLRSWWAAHWSAFDVTQPSFQIHLLEQRRLYLHAAAADLRALFDDKLVTYAHAGRLAVDTPSVLHVWSDPEQIELTQLPDRFCLKPVVGGAGRGVLPLERTGPRRYLDHVSGQERTAEWILGSLADVPSHRGDGDHRYFAEELLQAPEGRPLYDWKLYAFRGRVGAVLQVRRDRGSPRYRFYDGDFAPLGPVRIPERHDPSLLAPVSPESLVDVAARVSRSVPLPFVRVDLYETVEGVVVGELSPTPGRVHLFPPAMDGALGAMWEEAAFELGRELRATWDRPDDGSER